jgi:hypothetical protein
MPSPKLQAGGRGYQMPGWCSKITSMAFVIRGTEDEGSEDEPLSESAVPEYQLAAPLASSGIFAELAKPQAELMASTLKLAQSAGMNNLLNNLAKSQVTLAQSAGMNNLLNNLAKSQAALMRPIMPSPGLPPLASSGIFAELAKVNVEWMRSILPVMNLPWPADSRVFRDIAGILNQLETFAQVTQSDSLSHSTSRDLISRNRERLLFANFVYCLVLSLVLLAYFKITAEGEIDSQAFSLFTFATGLGAHQIAEKARKIAFHLYDSWYPQGL